MKRANGTGTIIKLKGNRRKPWFAKATVGYKENGQPIQKAVCNEKGEKYFESRPEAEETLIWWNKNHGNLNVNKLTYTFKQLFDEWSEIFIPTKEERKKMRKTHETIKGKLGLSNSMGLLAAAKKFKSLYNRKYSSIKKNDFQQIIYSTDGKKTKIVDMRNLIMKLDDYALGEDIIIKGYGSLLEVEYEESDGQRAPYTYDTIEKIWQHEGELIADIQLILLYTGMRIEELLFLDTASINMENEYWICGLKTEAGKNRLIPLHHEIVPIVKRYFNKDNKYLFMMNNGKRLYYDKYRIMYVEFMNNLQLEDDYTTHETRYTFRSELDRMGADDRCMDLLMGHQSGNAGNKVYNQKTFEELKATIELINYRKKKHEKITYLRA